MEQDMMATEGNRDIGPWLVFQGQIPHIHMADDDWVLDLSLNGGPGIRIRRGSAADYFVGPGLDDLIKQLAQSDLRDSPPASQS